MWSGGENQKFLHNNFRGQWQPGISGLRATPQRPQSAASGTA